MGRREVEETEQARTMAASLDPDKAGQ